MSRLLKEILIILAISLIAGIINNSISHSRVAWVGNWPSISDAENDSIWDCLSCEPGDPPLVNLSEASALYQNPEVIFVDARFPEEYEAGHIEGAVNLPFEASDEEFDYYYAKLEQMIDSATQLVTYCSGEECESSLHLGRYLRDDKGYSHISIFYGGWRRWAEADLPTAGSGE